MFLATLLSIALLAAVTPLHPSGAASVLFFITNDFVQSSNSYAPEIQRICSDYAAKGVSCTLVYSDLKPRRSGYAQTPRRIWLSRHHPGRKHTGHKLADATGATITPQAVVVNKSGNVLYRGRIDNFYAALGKPRRMATEHDLRQALDEALAGKPVTHPQTQALGCYIPR